jgi:hypothetical protein
VSAYLQRLGVEVARCTVERLIRAKAGVAVQSLVVPKSRQRARTSRSSLRAISRVPSAAAWFHPQAHIVNSHPRRISVHQMPCRTQIDTAAAVDTSSEQSMSRWGMYPPDS